MAARLVATAFSSEALLSEIRWSLASELESWLWIGLGWWGKKRSKSDTGQQCRIRLAGPWLGISGFWRHQHRIWAQQCHTTFGKAVARLWRTSFKSGIEHSASRVNDLSRELWRIFAKRGGSKLQISGSSCQIEGTRTGNRSKRVSACTNSQRSQRLLSLRWATY